MKKVLFTFVLTLLTLSNLFMQKLPENLKGIAATTTTGQNADKFFSDIDLAYEEVYKVWKKFGAVYLNTNSTVVTFDKKNIVLDKITQIRKNTQNSIDALSPFNPIPIIGTATKASQLTLQTNANIMDKVISKVDGLNNIALNPVFERAVNLNSGVINSESEVYNTLMLLKNIKTAAVEKCNCVANSGNDSEKELFEQGSLKMSEVINEQVKVFAGMNLEDEKINQMNEVVKKAAPVFDKTIAGLDDFMSKFKGSRKVIGEINDVLDKKFEKKVLGKKISLSVRDILTGGGGFKKAKDLLKKAKIDVDKWVKEAVSPITKKLGENLPGLPSLDKYYAMAEDFKNKVDEYEKITKMYDANKSTAASASAILKSSSDSYLFNVACNDAAAKNINDSAVNYFNIENRWKKTDIHTERGELECAKIGGGAYSAMWVIEPVDGTEFVKIKNRWRNTYLNVEKGKLESSEIAPGWHSAHWKLTRIPGTEYFYIVNRWKNTGINIEHGKIDCTDFGLGWHSAMWSFRESKKDS